jgi:hypothetical protein
MVAELPSTGTSKTPCSTFSSLYPIEPDLNDVNVDIKVASYYHTTVSLDIFFG